MEAKLDFNVLDTIEHIYNFSEDSKLRPAFYEAVEKEIVQLSKYLNVGQVETVLFANAFFIWFENDSFQDVFKHLDLSEFNILKFRAEIEMLYKRNLLTKKERTLGRTKRYILPQNVIIACSENLPLKMKNLEDKPNAELILVDLLEEFDKMSYRFDHEEIQFWELDEYITDLVETNKERPVFSEIKKLQLSAFEIYFFLATIWDTIRNGDNDFNTNLQETVKKFYITRSQSMSVTSQIVSGKTKLTKHTLIELNQEQFVNRTKVKISDKMVDFLREHENLRIDNFSASNTKLVLHEKLPERELFYNPEETKEMDSLYKILDEDKFTAMQNRLLEKNMPIGITALLHGLPGTGKTESVYQLAKKSGRNIFKVDISETKSMWFGESQKLIKKIFTDYKTMTNTEKRCPILLFNEADAVISKRKPAESSPLADTENSLQNIILEELENFEGILFATTNLVENMDSAFERRFLFKVKFAKPAPENAAKIWCSKLPFLTDEDSLKLAKDFNFSGGEMENIARKCAMNEILNGENPDFDLVKTLCQNEKWDVEKKGKIGFKIFA